MPELYYDCAYCRDDDPGFFVLCVNVVFVVIDIDFDVAFFHADW